MSADSAPGAREGLRSREGDPEAVAPGALVPARPTALVFASLAAGQALNFVALSLFSAWLGLETFGKYGICLLDFTVFCNLANFALPAASITMAVRGGFRDRDFSLAMGTRWWTSLAAAALYLLFEVTFRERNMRITAFALAPAVLFNPAQLEWWFVARQSWRDLVIHRCLGGAVTLCAAFLLVRGRPILPAAAAAYSAGVIAATFYLIARSAGGGKGLRLPWPRPGVPRMRWLWRKSLPLALTGGFDFLFLPLGFYAFKTMQGEGPLLGAYGAAYRLILAASLFASSLFVVLLPRFSKPRFDLESSLRRLFDGMALILAVPLLAAPFLAKPILSLLFPKAGWDPVSFAYAAWTLSTMALATYLHLLRMPPLTRTLAAGGSWTYCRRFILAGLVNGVSIGMGVWAGKPEWLPVWALAGDLVFTAGWLATLHPRARAGLWGRLAALAAWSGFYLAWARHWA
ncbi:MAG: polysaccharide biosynthesis protein [Fibrobacteres bacterium]|nr:polysaccharide biosynthesis protein [Fibrobacterota bacterium]